MKRITLISILMLAFQLNSLAQVPATVHATWTPNVASDNVTQYSITVDAAAPVIMLATACSPTLCSQILTIPAFGLHTVSLVAQNFKISGDPTTLQSSAPLVVTFTLAAAPIVVAGLKIIN